MLSKKLTISFLSLFTIIAFAIVAPSAMADTFDTTLKVTDVSAEGGNQVAYGRVMVTVEFGDAIDSTSFTIDDLNIRAINEFGGTLGPITDSDVDDDTLTETLDALIGNLRLRPMGNNGKTYQISFEVYSRYNRVSGTNDGIDTTDAPPAKAPVKVHLFIAAGAVDAADPTHAEKNKESAKDFMLNLVYGDGGAPRVLGIHKEAGLEAADGVLEDFRVIVTLSEEPKEGKFEASHLDVSNAAVGSIVKLVPKPPSVQTDLNTGEAYSVGPDGVTRTLYTFRGNVYPAATLGDSDPNTGLPFAINEGELLVISGDDPNFWDAVRVNFPGGQAIPNINDQGVEPYFSQVPVLTSDPRTSSGFPTPATGRVWLHYQYLVTIQPNFENKNDIVIKVKSFDDQVLPTPYMYRPPTTYIERVNMLTVKVGKEVLTNKAAGIEVKLLNEGIIPNGYLVVVENKAGSAVRDPGDPKKSPAATARQPFGLTYNLIENNGLPNLESFLLNGGTIDIVSPDAGLVISEIMWGSDASITDGSFMSQWIEIRNTSGADIKMGDGTHKLMFYGAGAVLPDMSVAANNIQDRVGTVGAGGYWSIAGKGQSGRTGVGEAPGDLIAVTPTQALISMQRAIDATGVAADGTMASAWAASAPPGLNFDLTKEGTRIGSPGRAPTAYPVAPTPAPEPMAVSVAMPEDLMITEIMVDTGDGRLPQWIEITNKSGAEVSLAGWSLMITNSDADADEDLVGHSVSINLSGMLGVSAHTGNAGKGNSLLLVAGTARSSSNLAGSALVMDVSDQVEGKGRYKLLSTMGFMAALVPPQTTGVLMTDPPVGNLDAAPAWDLPMSESGRSSLIRREMDAHDMETMGTAANGWVLAANTPLVSGPATWYGSDEDAGTPGYDAGGPLPVELSHFRPARDKATGAVVITWATQSELNNAGFFIKRSQQREGEFKVINATMVPGAGTTSEKQFYTYTDTTAQPNIVYYYQIEDVSFDGHHQTLTRGIRLKGHIGAAGKLTATWGELKSVNE